MSQEDSARLLGCQGEERKMESRNSKIEIRKAKHKKPKLEKQD
jgi:hypothetical protein